jgi:hypothetical protein
VAHIAGGKCNSRSLRDDKQKCGMRGRAGTAADPCGMTNRKTPCVDDGQEQRMRRAGLVGEAAGDGGVGVDAAVVEEGAVRERACSRG